MNKYIVRLSISCILLLLMLKLFAEVKLPAVFSDNVILQQKSEISIWGWANPGEQVKIKCSWLRDTYFVKTDNHGKWETSVKTPVASYETYEIHIEGDNNSIAVKDILFGEVWLCSGQSNMVFGLKNSINAKQTLSIKDWSNIRYMETNRSFSDLPLENSEGSVWQTLDTANVKNLSAVAIYFAIKLKSKLNVPIGIIESAWGGTCMEAWTPYKTLKADSILSITIDRWEEWKNRYPDDSICYYTNLAAFDNGSLMKKPEMPNSIYMMIRPHRKPASLYNGMIYPFLKFPIKGVLWYQGESNTRWSKEYEYLSEKMIQVWRKYWNKDIPFYYVQIAPFKSSSIENVSEVMEAQCNMMRNVKNVGMVSTMDVGNMKDIHPKHKKPVGERLANWALAKTYGFSDVTFSGPIFKNIELLDDRVMLCFDYSKLGLKSIGELKGFDIVEYNDNGTQKPAHPIDAIINNNKIVISTKNINKPFVLRYGWGLEMFNANLFSTDGLPTSPFRVLIK